jgi:hypothetical protein
MICSCCDFQDSAGRQFNAEKAAKELQAYRKGRWGQRRGCCAMVSSISG